MGISMFVVGFTVGNEKTELAGYFVSLIDLYSNFVCIVLCYKPFKKHYGRACGWMDTRCSACWMGCFERDSAVEVESNMANVVKISANTLEVDAETVETSC